MKTKCAEWLSLLGVALWALGLLLSVIFVVASFGAKITRIGFYLHGARMPLPTMSLFFASTSLWGAAILAVTVLVLSFWGICRLLEKMAEGI
ncbi:MAG TPA: hypothetical protein DEP42_00205 [Ruminococcaceae bacterium]|nr:hypothetical protein [Oscillospiraceae bacterium]